MKFTLFYKLFKKFKLVWLLLLLVITIILIKNQSDYMQFDEKSWYDDENISERMSPDIQDVDIDQLLKLKEHLDTINKEQKVHNEDTYTVNVTLIIVIQVHDRSFYLKHLLHSLEKMNGITKCMIIFSHDCFDNETYEIIQSIYFTRYIQIYYEYNIQLHPYVFPGPDLKFCSRNFIDCEVRHRDPEKTQLKHHWWWTVSTVFNKLNATKGYDGNIVFLEEDQYVTEDMVFVVKLLEKVLPNIYPEWDMITLGPRYPRIIDYGVNDTRLVVEKWGSNENIALVFNRTLWEKLRRVSEIFCHYNDYSWSNSLAYIGKHMVNEALFVASVKSARVFRFEYCQYSDDTFCHEVEKIIRVQNFAKQITKFLHPSSVSYAINNEEKPRKTILGGWRDVRDHELCMSYTSEYKF